MKKLSKSQIAKILEEVSLEVDELLKSEAASAPLQKADPGQETSAEVTPSGSSTDEDWSPENSGAPSHEPSAPEESAAAGPPAAEESSPQDPAAEGSEGGEELSPEALASEYSQLPLEELKMHFEAAKMALEQMLGGAGGDEGAAPGAAPPGAIPDDQAAPVPGTDMGKSEKDIADLKKSVEAKDKDIASLNLKVDKLADLLEQSLVRQQVVRKSIKDLSSIGTVEETPDISQLSKKEIVQKLNKVTASGNLSKSDRDLINKFVVTDMPVEAVAKFCK